MMQKLSFLSIGFITISVLFYGFFMLVAKNLAYYLAVLGEQVEIVAFIDDKLTDSQKKELLKKIENIKTIEKIKYTSKTEALAEFKKNPEFAKQIEILNENPLPATIDIYLKKGEKVPETIKETVNEIKKLGGAIEDIYYTSVEAENLLTVTKIFNDLRRWGNIITVLFVSFLFSAVSLSLQKKKILYGIIDGVIGSVIGFYILYLLQKFLFISNFKVPVFFTGGEIIIIFAVCIIVGVAVRIPKNVLEK
ncbi:MAG: permease-like cell division protein FtsX [Elusimicrobiota bacterium]